MVKSCRGRIEKVLHKVHDFKFSAGCLLPKNFPNGLVEAQTGSLRLKSAELTSSFFRRIEKTTAALHDR